MAASRLVPQARCTSSPGVCGSRPVDSSDSRVRLKSFGCLMTAPGDHIAEALALQSIALDQRPQRGGQQFLVVGAGIGGMGTGEWRAHPTQDGDALSSVSDQHVRLRRPALIYLATRLIGCHARRNRWRRDERASGVDRVFERRLAALSNSREQQLLARGRRGLERESLRVTPEGRIAQTPHPPALGSALTNPHITTDYSEALTELVTPTFPDNDALLQYLLRSAPVRLSPHRRGAAVGHVDAVRAARRR